MLIISLLFLDSFGGIFSTEFFLGILYIMFLFNLILTLVNLLVRFFLLFYILILPRKLIDILRKEVLKMSNVGRIALEFK